MRGTAVCSSTHRKLMQPRIHAMRLHTRNRSQACRTSIDERCAAMVRQRKLHDVLAAHGRNQLLRRAQRDDPVRDP